MSTQQTKPDDSTAETTSDQSPEPERHPDYEETTKSAYGTNGDAQQAFSKMQIKPSRVKRRSPLGKRFNEPAYYHYGSSLEFFQFDNGVGIEERTNGRSQGGITLRMASGETLVGLNVDQLWNFLTTVTDVGRASAPGIPIESTLAQYGAVNEYNSIDPRANFVIEFDADKCDDEYAPQGKNPLLVVLYDGSANIRSQSSAQRAGMLVTATSPHYAHVRQLIERDAYGELSDLVAPDEVLASELPVVTSSEYRRGDGWSPANEGGYGDEEQLGNVIIRQGEWYFIPVDEDFSSDMVEKPLSEYSDETALGSHVPRDQVTVGADTEQARLTDDGPSVEPGVYVRGTVRHERNEHSMFNLHEQWHRVVENTEDMYAFEQAGGGRWE